MQTETNLKSNPVQVWYFGKTLQRKDIDLSLQRIVIKTLRNKNSALHFFYCADK